MATYTQLSATATPGKRHQFTGAHEGLFTALSVSALPGARHSFTAKTPAVGHEGLFTALSVIALPGGRHIFLPKGLIVSPGKSKYHLVYEDFDLQAALKDDEDLTDILIMIIDTGLLD